MLSDSKPAKHLGKKSNLTTLAGICGAANPIGFSTIGCPPHSTPKASQFTSSSMLEDDDSERFFLLLSEFG
jgi:hypothetical protein